MKPRVLVAATLATGFLLGAGSVAALQGVKPWQQVGWTEWQQWTPESRQAWTDGFLAGAAAGQAPDSVFTDSTRFVNWMTIARPAGRRFPYGSPIYQARLQDWYHWDNYRSAELWRGVWVVNDQQQQNSR